MEKSLNKIWKESGSTLTFKEFADVYNKKKDSFESNESFLPFTKGESESEVPLPPVNAPISTFDTTSDLNTAINEAEIAGGLKNKTTDNSKILGINKGVFIFSVLLIAGAFAYYKFKKKE